MGSGFTLFLLKSFFEGDTVSINSRFRVMRRTGPQMSGRRSFRCTAIVPCASRPYCTCAKQYQVVHNAFQYCKTVLVFLALSVGTSLRDFGIFRVGFVYVYAIRINTKSVQLILPSIGLKYALCRCPIPLTPLRSACTPAKKASAVRSFVHFILLFGQCDTICRRATY